MSLDRITIDPLICHCKPCIRGMRWLVEVILDMLSPGMTHESILRDHPELEPDDIAATLAFAKLLASGRTLRDEA